MTPGQMAALHARCFGVPRPWTAAEFAELLASLTVHAVARPAGFALVRVVADEAELLTLAVAPAVRRQGEGRALMAKVQALALARGARTLFLEVAADNAAALALYRDAGFAETGRRRDYYQAAGGRRIDALVLARPLP